MFKFFADNLIKRNCFIFLKLLHMLGNVFSGIYSKFGGNGQFFPFLNFLFSLSYVGDIIDKLAFEVLDIPVW